LATAEAASDSDHYQHEESRSAAERRLRHPFVIPEIERRGI
jgi:hypothetical protein